MKHQQNQLFLSVFYWNTIKEYKLFIYMINYIYEWTVKIDINFYVFYFDDIEKY
jgi:hypothetical protein